MKTPKQLRDEAAERQRQCRSRRIKQGKTPYLRHIHTKYHNVMDLYLKTLEKGE